LEKGSYKVDRKGKAELDQDTGTKNMTCEVSSEKNVAWENPLDG
jgi:hypothetical protein